MALASCCSSSHCSASLDGIADINVQNKHAYLDIRHMPDIHRGIFEKGAQNEVIIISDRQTARVTTDRHVRFPTPRTDVVRHADDVSQRLLIEWRGDGASCPEPVVEHVVVGTLQQQQQTQVSGEAPAPVARTSLYSHCTAIVQPFNTSCIMATCSSWQ